MLFFLFRTHYHLSSHATLDFQLQAPVFELLYRVARLEIPNNQRDDLIASIPSDAVRENLMQLQPASFVVTFCHLPTNSAELSSQNDLRTLLNAANQDNEFISSFLAAHIFAVDSSREVNQFFVFKLTLSFAVISDHCW